MFEQVWSRSFCRTIEKLVEVVQEYPTEVEHIYSPSCVPLVRCAGCCGDEKLECHPTSTTNVTMQVGETPALTESNVEAGRKKPGGKLQSCEDRAQRSTPASETSPSLLCCLLLADQTAGGRGKKVHFLPQFD